MDIIAFVAPSDLSRARVAIGAAHAVRAVASINELASVLRVHAADVVLLDPEMLDTVGVEGLAVCLGQHIDVPIVGYLSVSPTGMRHAMTLAALGVRRVVLRGYDDQPSALRALLEGTYADSLAAAVFTRLAPFLSSLPEELQRAVEAAFRRPNAVRTVADLARVAGVPTRTCSRMFARAGLGTAHAFVSAARVVRAYHALRGRSVRVADVAARLGYGTPDALVRDTRRTTGLRPTKLVQGVAPELFIAQILHRLRTGRTHPSRPRRPQLVGHGATSKPASSGIGLLDVRRPDST